MAEIDRLELEIEAQATKANQQLDKLIGKLNNVSSSLSRVNASGLTGLANGVNRLATSMQSMNNVKTSDFTRLTKNIEKLGTLNTSHLNSAASSINLIGKSFNRLGGVSDNAIKVGELAKNISKLGNKSVTNAISNIPKLSSALNEMMSQLSKAPRISENLIRMTNAMSNLASQGSKVGSASRSINRGLGNYIGISDKATKSTKSLASSIGKLYASFWLIIRAVKALGSAIGSSMDYLETLNYFEVTVNKIGNEAASQWEEQGYDSAEAYYDSFRNRMTDLTSKMTGFQINADGTTTELDVKNLGLDANEILNYQATFAQMTDSMGVLEETALNASTAFTMLGADWASLKNLDMSTSMSKFASAISGQIRPVRELGIDISQATLQQYALKYGIMDNVQAMSQAAKVQLRLLAILDQSKVAMGDMANTLQSPANQLRILKQNFANLARIIGNMFLPIVSKILPYVNGLVIALRRLFTWLSGLMGIDISGLSSSIGDSSLDIEDMSDSTDDVTDGLTDAKDAAEALKNATSSIDELNVINQDTSSSSGSSDSGTSTDSGYGVLDDAITDALADYQALWDEAFVNMENKAEGIADSIEKAFKKIYDIAEPTRVAVKKLWDEGLSLFGGFAWTALGDFYDEFLVPLGKWTLGVGLPRFLEITNEFLKMIDWDKINTSLKNFWKALEPFAEGVGEGLLDFYEDMTKIGASFINVVVPGGLNGLANALNNISPSEAERIGYALGVIATSLGAIALVKGAGTVITGVTAGLPTITALAGIMTLSTIIAGIREDLKYIDEHGIKDFQVKNRSEESNTNPWSVYNENPELSSNEVMIENWKERISGVWEKVRAWFNGSFMPDNANRLQVEARMKESNKFIEDIGQWFVSVKNGFIEKGKQITPAIQSGWESTSTNFKAWLNQKRESVSTNFGTFKENFLIKGKSIIEGMQEGWNNLAPNFATWLSQKRESVPTNFGSYWSNFVTKGNDMINGIKQGWNDLSANFATWLGQKRESVVTNFGSYWNNFVDKGKDIINGIKQGWDNLSGGFTTWLGQKRESVHTNFGSYYNNFVDKGNEIMSGIKKGWDNNSNSFSSWLGDRRDNTVSWFGELKSGFTSKGADIINGIKQGWDNNWSSFSEWLSGLPAKIVSGIGSMKQKGKDLMDDFVAGLQKVTFPKFKIDVSYVDDGGLKSKMFQALGFDGYPKFGWSFYENGGLPNMGEAFIARENGPEMVGRIGNKSAVVNNDQITTSISDAVVRAMANANISNSNDELLREQNELLRAILEKDTNINLNGRKVNEELTNVKKSNGYSFAT